MDILIKLEKKKVRKTIIIFAEMPTCLYDSSQDMLMGMTSQLLCIFFCLMFFML